MSKLVMWNLVTLDGYFEGSKNWDLNWHEYVWGDELERLSIEQLRSAELLIFARVTYEGMAAYWSTAKGEVAELMNKIPKLVFSRTLETAKWENTTLVKENAAAAVRELKKQGSGNMFDFGSADFARTLMDESLFDEYRLALVPVVLGSGRALFGRSVDRHKLSLIEARPLASGCVILRYKADQNH